MLSKAPLKHDTPSLRSIVECFRNQSPSARASETIPCTNPTNFTLDHSTVLTQEQLPCIHAYHSSAKDKLSLKRRSTRGSKAFRKAKGLRKVMGAKVSSLMSFKCFASARFPPRQPAGTRLCLSMSARGCFFPAAWKGRMPKKIQTQYFPVTAKILERFKEPKPLLV